MSAALACPSCETGIRADARYCFRCGTEVRPPCPGCGDGFRWLATMGQARTPWCECCGNLLNACSRCGRWLPANLDFCPDPHCGGRVGPVLPQHTGRRWDGSGGGVAWRWPARWDRSHPEHGAPVAEQWSSREELHAAFVAHGRVFLWEGTNLVSPGADAAWTAAGSNKDADRRIDWRYSLGVSGLPEERVAPESRAALAGACVVLALRRGYLAVDLRHTGDSLTVTGGQPLAHAGEPGAWVGWALDAGLPALRLSVVGEAGELSEAEPVEAPAEAALAEGGQVVLSEGIAYWPGRNGAVWQLSVASREVSMVVEPSGGARPGAAGPRPGSVRVWAAPDGPRVAREGAGAITVSLTPPTAGRYAVEAPAGASPLRGVFAREDEVVVVGQRIVAYRGAAGDRQYEAALPGGVWVGGTLVGAEDLGSRFLALTVEDGFASVTAVQPVSGAHESLWRASGLDPRFLMAVDGVLYVAHRGGLVRLREAQAPPLGEFALGRPARP